MHDHCDPFEPGAMSAGATAGRGVCPAGADLACAHAHAGGSLVGVLVAALLMAAMRVSSRRRWSQTLDLALQVVLVLAAALALVLAVGGLLVDVIFRRVRENSGYGAYLRDAQRW